VTDPKEIPYGGQVVDIGGGQTTVGASTGPVGPIAFFKRINDVRVVQWTIKPDPVTPGASIYTPVEKPVSDLMLPGGSSTFKGVRSPKLTDKLDFISLMIALFAGTASLPHILIRYYTVKDAAAARKSTVVGIASIGFFYILTLYLGLGAMTSGALDPTPAGSNMAAPLLARTFGELPFAIISAIAFTTVLGTVSGLIMAASGAVAHDLMENVFKHHPNENAKVGAAKWTALAVGIIAIVLGTIFKDFNVTFLVGWAFNVAASANLPALVMLLFWRRTTRQGIVAAIWVGMLSSLTWLLLSGPAYANIYKMDASRAIAPFSQPGLVTIPLGFAVLVVVSLMTGKTRDARGFEVRA
jgi:cation/acetate symporter